MGWEDTIKEAKPKGWEQTIEPISSEEKDWTDKVLELGKDALNLGYEGVIKPIGSAIDYLDAPMREAAMAPARIAQGDIWQAVSEPIAQFSQPGSEAPSWKQVSEAYGIPEKKLVSPIVQGQPLYGSAYEQAPPSWEEDKVEVRPSQQAGVLLESALGGKGLSASLKAAKALGGVALKAGLKVADVAAGSTAPSELGKQAGEAIGATIEEAKKAGAEILDPRLVNEPVVFGSKEGNVVKEIFGNEIPSKIKYTPDSEIIRLEEMLADRGGGGEIVKKHNEGVKKVFDYVNDIPMKIAEKTTVGAPLPAKEAGTFLVDKYNDKVREFFNQVDFTRKSAALQLRDPEFNFPPITDKTASELRRYTNKMKNEVKGISIGKTNPVAQEAEELGHIIDDIQKMTGPDLAKIGNVNELSNKITALGRLAFEPKSPFAPVDKVRLQQLYHKMNEAFISDVGHYLGPEIAQQLKTNNAKISSFITDVTPIEGMLKDTKHQMASEKIFEALIEKGDSKELDAIQKILTPDEFNVLKASYLSNKLARHTSFYPEMGGLPSVQWKTLENGLKRDRTFEYLFPKDEKNKLLAALNVGSRLGTPYASKSGTGKSLAGMNIKDRLILSPMLARQKAVMEGTAKPIQSLPTAGLLKLGMQKQNVLPIIQQDPMQIGAQMVQEALQAGMPPEMIDQELRNNKNLSPSQSSILRNNLRKGQ